jgi:periplasmic divalent cation tolerance protein
MSWRERIVLEEQHVQMTTTTAHHSDALSLADGLVKERLAACVQILGPITSVYRWKGEVERAQEWMCLIKTRSALVDAVAGHIRRTHPYETPEITVAPIIGGSDDYLTWISSETQ